MSEFLKQLRSNWYKHLATMGPLGKSPRIPGTVGTLAGIPLVLLLQNLGEFLYMLFVLLIVLFAIVVCVIYERQCEKHDSREIVIDEVAGYLVAMTWLPVTWQFLLAAFVIFRIFDGLKPFPMSWLDKNIKGGVGVVADDVAAGICANVLLQIIFIKTNWLGAQLLAY